MNHAKEQSEMFLKNQKSLFHHVSSCSHYWKFVDVALESFGLPHIYVPGNHDPEEAYSHSVPSILPKITQPSTNLHNYCLKLDDHLWLAGFGGSTPKLNEDGIQYGPGYPFVSEDMKQEIIELISLIPKNDQVILITHCPPAHVGSSTVDQDLEAGIVFYLGSQSMYDQITTLMHDVGAL